ncbi:hypothetical protein AG4045_023682, partial [Apium graveolens]
MCHTDAVTIGKNIILNYLYSSTLSSSKNSIFGPFFSGSNRRNLIGGVTKIANLEKGRSSFSHLSSINLH